VRLEGVRLNVKDGTPLWANIDQGLGGVYEGHCPEYALLLCHTESELMSPSGGIPALE